MDSAWSSQEITTRTQAFVRGEDSRCYEWLGCHSAGDGGYTFRVWAPQAQAVSLVGEFCGWDIGAQPMDPLPGGVWECTLQTVEAYSAYAYHILFTDGQAVQQPDPLAFRRGPHDCLVGPVAYRWQTTGWYPPGCPPNVYEVSPAGWRRYADGRVFSYEALQEELISYVSDMGFTHVRLLDVARGFAPDPQYGSPESFMAFVDACHRSGLGVLVDWQPEEDDTPAVQSVALSRARYWLEVCGVDGLWVSTEDVLSPVFAQFRAVCPHALLLQASPGDVTPSPARSLLAGMPGEDDQPFAGVRTLLIYRLLSPMTHRLWMGDEFGQLRPWDPDGSLDWLLLDYESHRMLRHYVRTLNRLYLETPALWSGAVWIPENGVLVARLSEDIFAVCNTTPFLMEQVSIGVSDNALRRELFNSDLAEFGGGNRRIPPLQPTLQPEGGYPYCVTLTVPPLTTVLIRKTDTI